jgi:hypothetical protein
MREEQVYGGALIVGVVGMLVTAAFHPAGHQMLASKEAFAHVAAIGIAVHALALASTGVSAFGLVGLSRRLGIARLDVVGALVAFAMAVMGVIVAASASGFIAPVLGKMMFAADETARPVVRYLFIYNGAINQAFAKFHTVASSVAILLWSAAMLRTQFSRLLGAVGCVIGLATLFVILTGRLPLNVHGFGVIVLTQGVWLAWAGVLLILQKPVPAATAASP